MIPENIIKELIISGVRYKYESYDHKKACAEIEELQRLASATNTTALTTTTVSTNATVTNAVSLNDLLYVPKNCWNIPAEIKKNHIVWRTGRLREVHFNLKGDIGMFKIGLRYFKTFYLKDFGVTVKPLIFKSDDKYDLISQGLAIEETI